VTDEPFPRARFDALVGRLPAYLKLAWRLVRDPLLSRTRRMALVAAAAYLVSPVDAVPGAIPVLGQLDDLAVAIGAIKLALAGLSPARRREHLMAVGLVEADLMSDLRGIAAITGWILRKGGRLTAKGVRIGARAAVAGGRAAVTGAGIVAGGAKTVATRSVAAAGMGRTALRARLAERRDRVAQPKPPKPDKHGSKPPAHLEIEADVLPEQIP
jgi:uncharacterized membrane protein YkvA (DUF1232 family)